MERASLAQLSSTPDFGFDYEYQLPSDCLRVWATDIEPEQGWVWQIEGGKLRTNADSVYILYIKREDDPTKYSAGFYDLMATRMAAELAYSIAKDKTLAGNMWDLYNYKLRDARVQDGQEGTTPRLECNDLINVRYTNG